MRAVLLRSLPFSAVLIAACAGDNFVPNAGGGGSAGSAAGGDGSPNAGSGGSGAGDAAGSGSGAASTKGGSAGADENGGMAGETGVGGVGGDTGGGGDTGVGGDTGEAGTGGGGGAGQGAAAGKGGGPGKAGAGGTGGGGGVGGVGGLGGVGGSAGAGPTPCVSETCAAGTVCNSDGKCVACAETDTMLFGASTERFRPSGTWEDATFPRVTANFGARHLVFRMTSTQAGTQQIVRIGLDADGKTTGSATEAPNYVNKPEPDSGPTLLPASHVFDSDAIVDGGYAWGDVPTAAASYRHTILDSSRNGGPRRVHVARWWTGPGGTAGSDGYALLANFNAAQTENFSVAYAWAPGAKRAYWSRRAQNATASAPAELWTLAFGKSPSQSIAQKVTISGLPPGCAFDSDVEAWIDPEAKQLLFTARCTGGGPARRFFVAPLGASATPTALTATPVVLPPPSIPGEPHTPSLPADQCTLWYSQNGVIFSAPRR